ncbi:MAG: hypothetical protein IJM92_03265 [Fibrobacter sp.]|uniref:FISUMP domain-containing protein n=1 Tax=Fibrobacter sp. TaxID=35828 RepID=UPI0025C66A67|nr:FISUMP domain-containing protein [Fibrobacter sp.]MBQ7078685.1 hypothetical protein [Fibrobacter sp.]
MSAKNVSSSSKKGDAGKTSSSSAKTSSSSLSSSQKIASSSSVKTVSSSSVALSSSSKQSSSSKKVKSSSSSLRLSSANLSSSSKKVESSSSEYVPFDHSRTLAGDYEVGEDAYHQFTDPRNGRSYYYIKITSSKTGKSVTVMAENLNIGEMILGADNQNDDTKIERYCYNNDTTKCDEFGGLYQWAEVMQLPSRCNTESCSDLIQPNHQGVCPDGWRLFTWNDYLVVRGYKDDFNDGVKGLRSTYGFLGTNQSGFSLTGAGRRTAAGKFLDLEGGFFWFFPEEFENNEDAKAYIGLVGSYSDSGPGRNNRDKKTLGLSVRCTKLE